MLINSDEEKRKYKAKEQLVKYKSASQFFRNASHAFLDSLNSFQQGKNNVFSASCP